MLLCSSLARSRVGWTDNMTSQGIIQPSGSKVYLHTQTFEKAETI